MQTNVRHLLLFESVVVVTPFKFVYLLKVEYVQ